MYVMVHHKVGDYNKWKQLFDGDQGLLEQSGFKKYGLYKGLSDPNDLVVFCEITDVNKVKEFMTSERSVQKMKDATVIGTPELVFLDRIEKKEIGKAEKAA